MARTNDTPGRCPLCGGNGTTQHHTDPADEYCLNPNCNVAVRQWPRVAELVAIRDELLHNGRVMLSATPYDSYCSAKARCSEIARNLARQDAKNVGPRAQPETPAD